MTRGQRTRDHRVKDSRFSTREPAVGGGGGGGPSGFAYLLEDGVSYYLLEDGSSFYLQE